MRRSEGLQCRSASGKSENHGQRRASHHSPDLKLQAAEGAVKVVDDRFASITVIVAGLPTDARPTLLNPCARSGRVSDRATHPPRLCGVTQRSRASRPQAVRRQDPVPSTGRSRRGRTG